MKNKKKFTGGYIGLIVLLIGVALIVFYIVRTDIFAGNKNGQNMIEQGKTSIDAANEAKNLIEQNSNKSIEE